MEIVIVLLLILINGIFSMSEIAVVSMKKYYMQKLAKDGNLRAKIAVDLYDNPSRFLSTIQIGITLVGIFSGAFGGATIAKSVSALIRPLPIIGPFSDNLGILLVVLVITYLTLIFGELVPKRIAMSNPNRISLWISVPMRWFEQLITPVVRILSVSTEFILRIFMIQKSKEPEVTQDEIKVLVDQATKAGVFEKVEQDIVERVLRLSDRTAEDIMTPRSEVVWLDTADEKATLKTKILTGTRSRYPVCTGSLDKVIGVIHVKELLYESLADPKFDIKKFVHEPLFVPEHLSVFKLLEHFKESGSHLALTLDEYGVIQGVVTLNDVLEEMVGDIQAVEDAENPMIIKRSDGSFLADGLMTIDKFKKQFKLGKLPDEDLSTYHTLAGFIMSHIGKVPQLGHTFEWDGFKFEIVDIDGNRIDKVLVTQNHHNDPTVHPISK